MNLLKSRLALDDFILEMMRISPSQLQLKHLQDWVSRLDLKDDLLQKYISFCDRSYKRQLLCRTSRFELLILCWQPGQMSTIHDHDDSLNVTRVYQGVLTSKKFENHTLSGRCMPLQLQEEYLEKNHLATVERGEIHQLANTSDRNVVTLHVYARPLQDIRVYCPISGRTERVSVRFAMEEG